MSKLLTQEELNELIIKANNGDMIARNDVVENNMRLVTSIAKTFSISNPVIGFEDLRQEGYIGLVKAISKFKPEKGFKFSTYASWWIKQSIQRAIADNGRTIRVPVHVQEHIQRIKKAEKCLEQELNRDPSVEEILEKINVDCSYYDKIVNHDFFENLTTACFNNNGDEIAEIEVIILEDLEFIEDAEIVCKSIVYYMRKKKSIPTKEIITNKVNISKHKVEEYLGYNNNVSSLDVTASDDFESTIMDNIASDETIEDILERKTLQEGLLKAIDEVYGNEKEKVLQEIESYKIILKYLETFKKPVVSIDRNFEIQQVEESKANEFEKQCIIEFLNSKSNKLCRNEEGKKLTKIEEIKDLVNADKILELEKTKTEEERADESKNVYLTLEVSNTINKYETLIKNKEEKEIVDKSELIKRRYGLGGYRKETLQQLGERFNLSRERIRQIEKQIIGDVALTGGKVHRGQNLMLKQKIMEYCDISGTDFK